MLNIGSTWSASLQATGAFLPFDDSNLNAAGGKSRFETLVGTAMKDLFADAASGRAITADAIKAKPSAANQQVKAGG